MARRTVQKACNDPVWSLKVASPVLRPPMTLFTRLRKRSLQSYPGIPAADRQSVVVPTASNAGRTAGIVVAGVNDDVRLDVPRAKMAMAKVRRGAEWYGKASLGFHLSHRSNCSQLSALLYRLITGQHSPPRYA